MNRPLIILAAALAIIGVVFEFAGVGAGTTTYFFMAALIFVIAGLLTGR